jgi:hypothetical protein
MRHCLIMRNAAGECDERRNAQFLHALLQVCAIVAKSLRAAVWSHNHDLQIDPALARIWNGFHQIFDPFEGMEPVQAYNNWTCRVETVARTDVGSALLTQCVEVYARRRITIGSNIIGNSGHFCGLSAQTHRQRTDLRRIGAQHSSPAEDERQDHTNRKKAPIPVIELRHAHNIGAGQCDR